MVVKGLIHLANVKVDFAKGIDVTSVVQGATVVVGDNVVTNRSVAKMNMGANHAGDGESEMDVQNVLNIDRDVADGLAIDLVNWIQGFNL